MGLDMYMEKRSYVKNWEHETNKAKKHKVEVKTGGVIRKDIDPSKISQVVEDVGYWRKANQIHKWFVKNVQDGKDDCKQYDVSKEHLETLLKLCDEVIANSKLVAGKVANGYTFKDGKKKYNWEKGRVIKDPSVAVKLLPCESGFFFGSTDYNEWYIDDLKHTKIVIESIFKNDPEFLANYYYQSSW